jgi:hypothetical protein
MPVDRRAQWLVQVAALISGLFGALGLLGLLGGSGPLPGWVGFVGLMVALALTMYAVVRQLRREREAGA